MPINYEDIQEVGRKIEDSKGWKISNKIDLLNISHYIFMGNYNQLKQGLELFQRKNIALKLWNIDNREKLTEFQTEVIRLLHNYLASVKSLVDHTRIIVRDLYEGEDFIQEYQKKVNECFLDWPLSCFTQDLRNYILHKGIPIVSASITFQDDDEVDNNIYLNKSSLLLWDNWSKKSKEYLNILDKRVKLCDIVNEYSKKVIYFYIWFGEQQREIHSQEFKETEELQKKFKEILNEYDKKIK